MPTSRYTPKDFGIQVSNSQQSKLSEARAKEGLRMGIDIHTNLGPAVKQPMEQSLERLPPRMDS